MFAQFGEYTKNHWAKHLKMVCFMVHDLYLNKKIKIGTSLVVKWLRLLTPNAGGQGSIPGQETKSLLLI